MVQDTMNMYSQDEQWLLTEKYQGVESEAFHADRARLQAGEPLGYIIGFVPFLNSKIWLDGHPLIPRPETEFWVEKAINTITGSSPKILDLCAGSGAVGVSVAEAIPEARVDLAEIDPLLLPTIEKNLRENVPDYETKMEQYRTFQSDLFENVAGTYDRILTNPPYIDPALDRTQASVKDFEPHLALYGGESGMEIIARIITNTARHLTSKGQLWIEHEPEQSSAIQKLGSAAGFTVSTHVDQYEVERFSVLLQ